MNEYLKNRRSARQLGPMSSLLEAVVENRYYQKKTFFGPVGELKC
jgi:hypothetical protein